MSKEDSDKLDFSLFAQPKNRLMQRVGRVLSFSMCGNYGQTSKNYFTIWLQRLPMSDCVLVNG